MNFVSYLDIAYLIYLFFCLMLFRENSLVVANVFNVLRVVRSF